MALDLEPWPWLTSRSRPGHRLDLEPLDLMCHGSKSNLWPGLDLDLSHSYGSRSNPLPGLDLDLSHGHGCRSNVQQGLDLSHGCGSRSNLQPGLDLHVRAPLHDISSYYPAL